MYCEHSDHAARSAGFRRADSAVAGRHSGHPDGGYYERCRRGHRRKHRPVGRQRRGKHGQVIGRATPDVSALTRAAAGVAIEAIGGPPARRNSSNGLRRWIEVRGLAGEHASVIACRGYAESWSDASGPTAPMFCSVSSTPRRPR